MAVAAVSGQAFRDEFEEVDEFHETDSSTLRFRRLFIRPFLPRPWVTQGALGSGAGRASTSLEREAISRTEDVSKRLEEHWNSIAEIAPTILRWQRLGSLNNGRLAQLFILNLSRRAL